MTQTQEHHGHHMAQMHTTLAQHYNITDAYVFSTQKPERSAHLDPTNCILHIANAQLHHKQIRHYRLQMNSTKPST